MRLVLAGTRSFGVAALEAIEKAGHDIVAAWVPWDDRLSRAAQNRLDPGLVRERWSANDIEKLEADLIVCAHSHAFVSAKARQATRLGGIGYHPSLLPRHRGRDAVRWTVHMGDAVAGGSVYWLTDNVDGGPIAAQDWCFVPTRPAPGDGQDQIVSELWRDQLFPMGVRLLLQVLGDLERGVIVEVPQQEWAATWEPSWERPPLFRPELTQIGPGMNGYRHVTTKEALHG